MGPTLLFMKCVACQKMCIHSRRGIGIDCKILQKSIVKIHENIVGHINLVIHW